VSGKKKRNNPEADLAEKVVAYLRGEGWTVYPEIQVKSFGAIADIVAVRDDEVMVIETKMSFGLEVLGQAHEWKSLATYVAAGVPASKKRSKARSFGQHVCWNLGIGLITVDQATGYVREQLAPRKTEGAKTKVILDTLTEAHKTYAKAGNADKKYLTKFKVTIQHLVKYVRANPDCCLKTAVTKIKHHYKNEASARSSLGKQIYRFENVPELVGHWDKKARCLRLRLRESPSPRPPRRKPLDSVK
jgi:hypothetical protein